MRLKITQAARSRRFYDFASMRLQGKSDTTYRQYDLLREYKYDLLDRPLEWMVKYAGLYWPVGGEYEVLTDLQRHFEEMGFGTVSTPGIKKLIKEFYIYAKIRYENMRWCMRDPDESLMLYRTHQKAMGLIPTH